MPARKAGSAAKGGGDAPADAGATLAGGRPRADAGQAAAGGGIVVTHTTRQLKSYNFTDSDLDTIGLANLVSGVSFSLATAIATFSIDFNKDLLLADNVPPTAEALQFTLNWVGLPIALCFFCVGIIAQTKRGGVIKRVKQASKNVE